VTVTPGATVRSPVARNPAPLQLDQPDRQRRIGGRVERHHHGHASSAMTCLATANAVLAAGTPA
jgi:hypothetical protein